MPVVVLGQQVAVQTSKNLSMQDIRKFSPQKERRKRRKLKSFTNQVENPNDENFPIFREMKIRVLTFLL